MIDYLTKTDIHLWLLITYKERREHESMNYIFLIFHLKNNYIFILRHNLKSLISLISKCVEHPNVITYLMCTFYQPEQINMILLKRNDGIVRKG